MRARGWLETVPGDDARTQSFRLTAQARNLEKAYPCGRKPSRAAEILGKEEMQSLQRTANKLKATVDSPP